MDLRNMLQLLESQISESSLFQLLTTSEKNEFFKYSVLKEKVKNLFGCREDFRIAERNDEYKLVV